MDETKDKVMALCSAARRQLAEAVTVQDLKTVRDVGEAAVRLAKSRRDVGIEALLEGTEIVRRAEWQIGAMLPAITGGKGGNRASHKVLLGDLGIERMQSSRFQRIASLSEEQFESWIASCREAKEEMTQAAALKLATKLKPKAVEPSIDEYESGAVADLGELVQCGLRYGCIYADPPWAYSNKATRANVDDEYKSTMTVDEICQEPVSQLAADDCHLHLWTTNAFLFEAKRVMEAWGFEYKSCFVWVKPQMGIGNYWRVSHEFMLLGIRGKPEFRRRDCMSWGEFDRTAHSKKPSGVRKLIESVSPGPYLELYGRETVPNWMVYGNEVSRTLFDVIAEQSS
jgi:N6-adenosine-specific RNA methylase IME4